MTRNVKTALFALTAAYLLFIGILPDMQPAWAQGLSSGEVTRRIERLEGQSSNVLTTGQALEHRITVLEIVAQQSTDRLNSIESLLRALLIGMACLIGETVWTGVLKVRQSLRGGGGSSGSGGHYGNEKY